MLRRVIVVLLVLAAGVSALWLLLHRQNISYRTLDERYAADSSHYLTLSNDLVVHFTDEGSEDAPVIVLVHGFASSLQTWRDWRAGLIRDFRVISVDLPSHGLTRKGDAEVLTTNGLAAFLGEFITELELENVTLVGSSMGGHAGWVYALDHPEHLSALVLIGAAGMPPTDAEKDDRPFVYGLVSNVWAKPLLASMNPKPLIRDGLNGAYFDPAFVTDALVQQYSDLALAPGHRTGLLTLAARSRVDAREQAEQLKALDLPVLILHGADDRIIPAAHGERLNDLISNARLIIYPETGHLPHEERADQTLSDLKQFLASLSSDEPETETTISEH